MPELEQALARVRMIGAALHHLENDSSI